MFIFKLHFCTIQFLLFEIEFKVLFLGWDDPLEKEIATHSSILAWEILWTEMPGGLQSIGSQESQM